jgi:hypothetical protein
MLLGEPGIGKSSWLEALVADGMRTKVFVLACNQLADKADVTGARLVPTPDGSSYMQVFYPHEVIQNAIAYANAHPHETPVLFMDELNRTTPDVTSELLSIPTMRSIGGSRLPRNLAVVIAGNDKGNVTSLDDASVSRFVLYHVKPDVETFLSLDDNLNVFIRSVLEHHPDTLLCKTVTDATDDDDEDMTIDDTFDVDDGMRQFTTPRTISGLSGWLNQFDNDELKALMAMPSTEDGGDDVASVLQEVVESHVGHTRFSMLLIDEIQTNVSRVDNRAGQITVERPEAYDRLRAARTLDDMDVILSSMPAQEVFGALVYALYDNVDNTALIEKIAPRAGNQTRADMDTLMQLNLHDNLDADNVRAFMSTGCDMAVKLEALLSRFLTN